MKQHWIVMSLILAIGSVWVLPTGAAPPGANHITVTSFGARGDGANDDTAAIQAAINALESRGGGTLTIPRGTYLLNSYKPSPHPWYFYNLRVGSNITVQGEPGARLLQGPSGRAKMAAIPGATEVATSVLVFGSSNFVINTFQDKTYNGGFYSLHATHANDRSVMLAAPAQASKFRVGDYVAIYAEDPTGKDVIPSESSPVTSVSPSGVLGLKHPLTRAFPAPLMAKVTSLATVNVGVNNLIIQGTIPLNVNEVFGFAATRNTFLCDTSIGDGNLYSLIWNNLHGVHFEHNTVTSIGPHYVPLELPQRNSQDVVIASNTINMRAVGFGEYAAHWILTDNTISVHPDHLPSGAAVFFGGYDILFRHNHVQGSATTLPLIADWVGLSSYAPYVGRIRIENNVFDCRAEGANCLNIAGRDTTVTDNVFNIIGNCGEAILVEGPLPQTIRIDGN
ncbi:MAG TPA: glycosyl hydrolase family 28-related protein, partial [Chthonomonadaceae bacterium]|nr:glycosyl hydrolase family 28-related protein [Chthonomonadaceae bacterium]